MRCPYCYIPFIDPHPGDLVLWKEIIEKISLFSPDLVTFGGGDPFAQPAFFELLEYCRNYSFDIHVDTNAIRLPHEKIGELGKLVDLIGLPLDGNATQHDLVRNYKGHYDIVKRALTTLEKFNIPTKVNTVYFPELKGQLTNIAHSLSSYANIRQWFIYEYWHFKGINAEESKYGCGEPNFPKLDLQQLSGIRDIHYSSVDERSPAYIFVSSIGNIYTIGEDKSTYKEICNILDSNAELFFESLGNLEAIDKRTQLKQIR